jgi:HD-GYP domain-containing protein (c-di-GMP phosphodiesterase class II)
MSDPDFIPISVATLLPSSAVGLDLFQIEDGTGNLVLYRSADYPLAPHDLKRLHQRGIHRLYISKDAQARYQKYLRQLASIPPEDTRVPLYARLGAMDEVVRDVLTRSLSSENDQQAVSSATHLGKVVTRTVTSSAFATSDLMRVLHHDYTTFTHSANVAFYATILANKLGFSQDEIEQVATAGLLHDIGKLEIAEEILCKPGRLDESEFREIRRHPLVGFRRLALRPELTFGQLMIVYQHHERLDGKGYPVGVVSEEIHLWAKLCTVVDVYEALTSQRPYRQPMTKQKALETLHRDSGTAFDPEILACWTSIIQTDLNR